MAHKIMINGVDLADYVIFCEPVPNINCNDDKSTIASQFQFDYSYSGPAVSVDDVVEIYSADNGAVPFFIGFIISKVDDTDERKYLITVAHKLLKLANYLVNYDTLHSHLIGGTADDEEYRAIDNMGYPNVQILYLMEIMCLIAGITLRTSSAHFNFETKFSWENNDTYTHAINDIKIDENVLYSLNQNGAGGHAVFETVENRKLTPTFLDLFQLFTSLFNFASMWSTSGTPKELVIFKVPPLSIPADDDLYSKKIEAIQGDGGGYGFEAQYNIARGDYTSGTLINLGAPPATATSGSQANSLSVYNNLYFLYKNPLGSPGDVLAPTADPSNDGTVTWDGHLLLNKTNALTVNKIRYKYETAISKSSYNVSNFIDLENFQSTLIQDVY